MFTSRMCRVAFLAIVGAVLLAASTSPVASAAGHQRYASPGGSVAAACTYEDPCALATAVSGAVSGDEVIVAPGDYPVTATLAATGLTIHGIPGRPRPRLLSNGVVAVVDMNSSTLRYVEVDHAPGQGGYAIWAGNSLIDQVIARGSAQPDQETIEARNTTLRDSVVIAPGSAGRAIETYQNGGFLSGTFRNVTAIATETGGVAIQAAAQGASGYVAVLARNVIARGGPGGASFDVWTDDSGATAKITVDHSNWLGAWTSGTKASLVDGGANQTAAPAFVNAAAGDYREAPGSPTIDAGLGEFLDGDFDLDGDLRQLGAAIDIGADEFVVAPVVATGPATDITDRSATLSGSVDPNGAHTGYRFEYGPTTAYGSTTPEADGGEVGTIAAAATLGALSPATTYHYRLVATNAGGTSKGADRTFTTASSPTGSSPTGSSPTPTPTPTAFAGVSLVSSRLAFDGRFVAPRLLCPVGTIGRCTGRITLTAKRRASGSRSATAVRLGTASFSIATGTQAKVKVRVSRAGRRLLRRGSRLKARDTNAARDGAGRSMKTVAAVTIRRRYR